VTEEADFVFNVLDKRAAFLKGQRDTKRHIFFSVFSLSVIFVLLKKAGLKISCALTIDGRAAISHV